MKLLRNRPAGSSALWIAALVVALHALPSTALAIRWPWNRNAPWPSSSKHPVEPLAAATLESRLAERAAAGRADGPVVLAVFGDQRALADGEWQALIREIARLDREERPIDAVLDTGDIVSNGSYADQFELLHRILAPIRHKPYLVAIGNHELEGNRSPAARSNSARFLAPLDAALSVDRFYYRKDIGPAAILFLDTNDFVYGETGDRNACPLVVDPATREGRQVTWLRNELARLEAAPRPLTIAVMHHPLVQSSEKHKDASCSLWNFRDGDRTLVDILADGGVDIVLTGHTHTYERFRLRRDDGREIHLLNISGRPRDAFLWFGASDRRARDLRGREDAWLEEIGWLGLDRWTVVQEDAMLQHEADQFALLTLEPEGGVVLDLRFLASEEPPSFRKVAPVRLR